MYLDDYSDTEFSELNDLAIFRKVWRGIRGGASKLFRRLRPQVQQIPQQIQQRLQQRLQIPVPQIAPQIAPQVAPQPAPIVSVPTEPIQPIRTKARPFYLNPFFIGGVGLAIIILILILKKRGKQNVSQLQPQSVQ